MKNFSNLRRSLRIPSHQFDFSNTVDDPIEIEEVEDPSKECEKGLACGEETSSEDSSQDTSNALNETETIEGSLDERVTTVGEGQHEHTFLPTPPISSSPLFFSYIFLFFALYFPFFAGCTEINFPGRGRDGFLFGLVFS